MFSSRGATAIKVVREILGLSFSPSRRRFLIFSAATGTLTTAQWATAQTIPVMFWAVPASALPAGAIAGGPICDGPLCGPP